MSKSRETVICFEDNTAFDRGMIAADIAKLTTYLGKNNAAANIAIHCQSTRLFLVALAATWLVRGIPVLPASDKQGYLDEIAGSFDLFLNDAAIAAILAEPENRLMAQGHIATLAQNIPAPETCRATFYTSGSTGAPKAIGKTLAQLEAEMALQTPLWQADLTAGCRIWGLVSHQHIYGLLFRVIWPVMTGVPFMARQARFWEDIIPGLGTGDIIIASPAHLQRLHPDLAEAQRPARIFCSGGPLDQKSAGQAHAALGIWPTEILGSTETGGIAWRQQTTTDTPWQPLPDVKTSQNAEGCLMVAAPHINGDNWYHTADRVAFDGLAGQNRFRLLGRADRIVKIEGKRISLDRVETHLRNHDWVENAVALLPDDADNRLGAIVVLTPQGQQHLQAQGAFQTGRSLRSHISHYEEDAALPRRWRFVDTLPTDSQGKKPLHLLRALFAQPAPATPPALLPGIVARSRENDSARLTLRLSPDMLYFQGHFPGSPILPGVVQLHWAVHYAQDAFDIVITAYEVTQLKYRKVITPDDQIHLQLTHDAARGQVKFTYSCLDGDYSSGILKFSQAS
ncbi:AMP-binding protein [Thalassospira sp. TSL5-1]|uniref:ApeI family dehydratase n=1 Tax=Thalassospira sp. TSL5-1 TaxID=1544451 RepID=UPI001439290B|nr:AMP-binding protein [Thalassospira sp. TSL5-1]